MVFSTCLPPKREETRCFSRFLWELEFANSRGELTYHGKGPFIEEPAYSYGFYMGKNSSRHEASIVLKYLPQNPTSLCHFVRMSLIEEATGKKKLFYRGVMAHPNSPARHVENDLPTYCRGRIREGKLLSGLLYASNEVATQDWVMSIFPSIVLAPVANRAWRLTFPSITTSYFEEDVDDFLDKWWAGDQE